MKFIVATVTPFDARGRVDLARLRAHIMWLSAMGADGFAATSFAGEFLYLTDREREAIHRTILDTARDKQVFPCTWDPSLSTMRYLTEAAREQGATQILMPPPLLYDVHDDVVESWYCEVHELTEMPVLALHSPKHVHAGLSTTLYHRLRDRGVLAGMQDDSGDIYRLKRTCERDPGAVYASRDRLLGEAQTIEQCAGFVSVLANAWPSFCTRVFRGDDNLNEALVERVNRTRAAGGVPALKGLLRMGCRAPLTAVDPTRLERLPPSEV